ncbi:MAG: triose-phosphate isomerase [Candidatus Woesearchaeota archaeon]
MKPLIFLNFKAYEQGTAGNAERLAVIAGKVAKEKMAEVILIVQNSDIFRVSQKVGIPVYAQHADEEGYGSRTGHEVLEVLKANGASGVMLNHSECRIPMEKIKKVIERCREVGMAVLVCAPSVEDAVEISKLEPDYVAYEDPELIGSGKSVTEYSPKAVEDFVEKVKGFSAVPLCGAGISTGEDVKAAVKLGTKGVLLASGFVKAEDPEKVLLGLVGE